MTDVGFIGLGAMGGPMVARLSAAGFGVLVHDTDPSRTASATKLTGVSVADSLGGFRSVPTVICMLPSSDAVRQVVSGPDGLLSVLQAGALIVDMGSSEPQQTVDLARQAAGAGLSLVDAPVSGGVVRARSGDLAIMFGGSTSDLERSRAILEALGSSITHVGPAGAGHALKALNNLLSAIGLAAACEIVETGRRFGLDPHLMLEVINRSTGRNHATENKLEQFVLSGSYGSGFAMRLMLKDLRTAVGLAHSKEVAIPLGEACLEVWEEAARSLPADADHTMIALAPVGLRPIPAR